MHQDDCDLSLCDVQIRFTFEGSNSKLLIESQFYEKL